MSSALPAPSLPSTIATGAVHLLEWGLIRAKGTDAAAFLHGQLTQDVQHLEPGHARLAGYCSAKGRLLASLVIWRVADDEFLMACSADLLPATLKRLTMFVLRSKCKLSDAGAELALFGVTGDLAGSAFAQASAQSAGSVLSSGMTQLIRLSDVMDVQRRLLIQPRDMPAPAFGVLPLANWQWLEVRSAVARITAETVDQFVPQMVNLELVGGVNFQKGCYPGQEVVARSQYRGTLKRRAMVFDCDDLPSPGQEVFHSLDPDQPAGMVTNAAPRPGGGFSALVQVKLAALETGRLHLGSADGAVLRPLILPYAMPVEAP